MADTYEIYLEKAKVYAEYSQEELYALLGEEVYSGMIPPSFDQSVEKGKEWLNKNLNKITDIICRNDAIRKMVNERDKSFVIALTAFLINKIAESLEITNQEVLAAIVVKSGLHKLCKTYWES